MVLFWSFVISVCVALVAVPSCSGNTKKEISQVGQGVIDCAKTNGQAAIADVAAILITGADDWQGQLEALAGKLGVDVVACAARDVEQVFFAQPNTRIAQEQTPALERAQEYTDKFKYAGSGK